MTGCNVGSIEGHVLAYLAPQMAILDISIVNLIFNTHSITPDGPSKICKFLSRTHQSLPSCTW